MNYRLKLYNIEMMQYFISDSVENDTTDDILSVIYVKCP